MGRTPVAGGGALEHPASAALNKVVVKAAYATRGMVVKVTAARTTGHPSQRV
jgi:hypothetical protein